MKNEQLPLVEAIGEFIERHSMSSVTFGRLALKDPNFVRDLRGGRRLWPETEAKVRSFMADYAPTTEVVAA